MSLPNFKKGQPLTAAGLNMLAERVRGLQRRAPQVAMATTSRTARFIPGRQFAFRLATWNGLVWCRQGWVDTGNGRMYCVGDKEWTDLGSIRPMTVWLKISETEGELEVTEYDDRTPETNLRRRLGYVREETVPGDEVPVWHCVQLLGGLIAPCAPRRAMGKNNMTGAFEKGDRGWDWTRAGNLRGKDFEVAEGRYYAGRSVGMGFMTDIRGVQQDEQHGGNRLMQTLLFCGGG